MGQFDMTTGGLETEATVNVFGPGNQAPNLLTLEALRNGVIVASASTRLSGRHLIEYRKLQVRGPHRMPFDQLRLVASGTANNGAVFMVLDTVTVRAS